MLIFIVLYLYGQHKWKYIFDYYYFWKQEPLKMLLFYQFFKKFGLQIAIILYILGIIWWSAWKIYTAKYLLIQNYNKDQ